MSSNIVAIVIARDEEKNIAKTLNSIKEQTSKPYIIVVDDGSIDNTPNIAEKIAELVIRLPRHEESWAGKPQLARVFNAGFKEAKKLNPDFLLISGADSLYPRDYVEIIVSRMKRENVVIASGIAKGERARGPRGSGRIIDANWFNKIGFKYPENWGFESYVIFKALSMGFKVKVYTDVYFELSRRTTLSPMKAYYWGLGMRALNYWFPYALGRILLISLKSPKSAFYMFKGYMSHDVKLYDDIRYFVPNFQKRYILYKLGLKRFSAILNVS